MADKRLSIEIAVNDQDALYALRRVEAQTESMHAKAQGMGEAMRNAVFLIAGATVSAVGMIGAGMQLFANYTGKINDLANKAGMTTTEIQKLGYAAKMNGVEMETMVTMANRLSRVLGEGSKSTIATLATMGLSLKDLRNAGVAEAFTKVGDAAARIQNPIERTTALTRLMGRGGAEAAQIFSGNLSATAAEAERLGLILDERTVAAGDRLGDTLDTIKLVGMSLLARVLMPMVPAFTAVAGGIASVIPVLEAVINGLRMLPAVVALAIGKLYDLGASFGEALPGGWVGTMLTGGFAQRQAGEMRAKAKAWTMAGEWMYADTLRDINAAQKPATRKATISPYTPAPEEDKALDAQRKKIADLDRQIQLALSHGQDYDTLMSEFGKQSMAAIVDAQTWGLAATNNIKAVAASYNDDLIEGALKKLSVETKKLSRDWLADEIKTQEAIAQVKNDAIADQLKANEEYAAHTRELSLSGAELEIAKIRRERDAALAGIKVRLGDESWFAQESLAIATAYYNARLRKAKEEAKAWSVSFTTSLSSLSQAFSQMAQIAGGGKTGETFQWIANTVGAMSTGAKAGQDMAKTMIQLKNGSISMATGYAQLAVSIAAVAAAMDQATQGTNKWQAAISGAMTGAAAGATMSGGNPYAIAGGAIIGGIYGYYKAKKEEERQLEASKAKYMAAAGGAAELTRQLQLTGASADTVNKIMAAENFTDYNKAVESATIALTAHEKELKAIRAAAEGTKTLANSMFALTQDQKTQAEALMRSGLSEADAFAQVATTTSMTQAQFERLGTYTAALFAKMIQDTGSVAEALMLMGDTLDAIIAGQTKFGFSLSAPMQQMAGLRNILRENDDLAQRISGLSQIGKALGPLLAYQNVGGMNLAGTFGADITELFNQLKSRQGVSDEQAMLLMQAPMQQLWEANGSNMAALDESTRVLMSRMLAEGYIGENMKSLASQQLEVMKDIRDILAPPGYGAGGGAGGGSQPKPIPGYPPDGGESAPWDPWTYAPVGTTPPDYTKWESFAGGTDGYQYFGSGTPAMLHGWEKVDPLSKTHAGASQVQAPIVIHTHVNLDGREVAANTARHLPKVLAARGVKGAN